jgi:aminotransferase
MDDVISLGIGEPDFVTPPKVIEAGLIPCTGAIHTTPATPARSNCAGALASYLNRLYQINYDPEHEILITVGASEALYLAMTAILDPGDEVIVPEPCFVAYMPEAVLAGGVPISVRTRMEDSFQVTSGAIEAAITPKTKAILIGYPNNPTGAVMSRERLLEIARLAEKHDLLVISDEIYDRLVYGGPHTHFAALDAPVADCRASGLSKPRHDWLATWIRRRPAELIGAMRSAPIHHHVRANDGAAGCRRPCCAASRKSRQAVSTTDAETDRPFNEPGLTVSSRAARSTPFRRSWPQE